MQTGALSRAVTTVVRHPWAMRWKRVIRDVRWRVAGAKIENPALPGNVRSILFVCLGNICRSPFAGRLAEQRFADLPITFGSAGIRPSQSDRSPDDACAAAETFGVSLLSHRPAALTTSLVKDWDLIVVMELSQLELLRQTYPAASARIVLLSLFDDEARGHDRYCIEDPYMRPLSEFVACYKRIDRAMSGLLAQLDVVSPATAKQADLGLRARVV